MDTRISWLQSKLKTLREQISKEDYTNWLQLTETKLLFLHLESDLEEHKENWASMNYGADNKAEQSQAAYIMELMDIITNPYDNEVEITDDES